MLVIVYVHTYCQRVKQFCLHCVFFDLLTSTCPDYIHTYISCNALMIILQASQVTANLSNFAFGWYVSTVQPI